MGSSVGEGGILESNAAEVAAVTQARGLRAQGRSPREIVAALEAEGHRPRGKRWHVQTLARVIRA